MGRGTSGALATPPHVGAGSAADSDQRLVARVRRGDDRAFELLYHRYHRRIHAYVLGMVKDHGRAEDVTQEVFVSALRRMRETEQPLAFKPWLYQIARNSCIDAFRRSRRAEEVSYDSDAGLAPADHSKLVSSGPSPDAAVAAKHDLDSLRGAFGGLSETHHEILVLRELEGLSYAEIGRRMGMSRPAVESTLFRARRRLTEEFDDIVSGARCLRIQGIIAAAVDTRLGARDTRRLARHLAHCQPCRREALAAGLDRELFTRPSVPARIAARVAAWLPLPAFLRFRRGAADAPAAPPGRGASLAAHLPMLSDQLSGGWSKAAAGAALLVAGVGAGMGVERVATQPPKPPAPHSATRAAATPTPVERTAEAADVTTSQRAVTKRPRGAAVKKQTPRPSQHSKPTRADAPSSAAGRATSPGGSAAPQAPAAPASPSSGSAGAAVAPHRTSSGGGSSGKDGGGPSTPVATPIATPIDAVTPPDVVTQTTGAVEETTHQAAGVVRDTAGKVTSDVNGVTQKVTGGGIVGDTVSGSAEAVNEVADDAAEAVDQVGSAVGGLTGTGG